MSVFIGGCTLADSFVNCAYGMLDYMSPRSSFGVDPQYTREVTVEGRDLESLLFNFLDEIMCLFVVEPFRAIKEIRILEASFADRPFIRFQWYYISVFVVSF